MTIVEPKKTRKEKKAEEAAINSAAAVTNSANPTFRTLAILDNKQQRKKVKKQSDDGKVTNILSWSLNKPQNQTSVPPPKQDIIHKPKPASLSSELILNTNLVTDNQPEIISSSTANLATEQTIAVHVQEIKPQMNTDIPVVPVVATLSVENIIDTFLASKETVTTSEPKKEAAEPKTEGTDAQVSTAPAASLYSLFN